MRKRVQQGVLSLHVIAGTYVVLLGFNLPEAECDGLLGFSIHRTDHTENEAYYLEGMKAFAETDPGFPAGSTYSTDDHPIQSFQWADYTAKPGHSYTYTVTARKGTPAALTDFAEVSVTITTESPEGGDQDIYFNRGVAASQAYVRRFGNRAPNLVQNNQAFIWLSRGIYEAMSAFMRPAEPERYSFLIAAYEFHYRPFLDVVRAAANQSDVKVIYDARNDPSGDPEKPSLTDKNRLPSRRPRSAMSRGRGARTNRTSPTISSSSARRMGCRRPCGPEARTFPRAASSGTRTSPMWSRIPRWPRNSRITGCSSPRIRPTRR